MTAAAVALRGYVLGIRSKQVRGYVLGIRSEKGKKENRKNKIEERNIFLSRDSCSCRAKEATYWGFVRSKQEATYWGFVRKKENRKI